MTTQSAPPTPERFFNVMQSYVNSAVLRSAIELHLFTAIAQGNNTADKIAAAAKVHPRGARILADHLTILGFLKKDGSTYSLAEDTALFLDENSPAYLGAAAQFLHAKDLRANFDHFADRVRDGGAAHAEENFLAPNHDVWVKFARGMAGLMMMPAQNLARVVLASPNLAAPKPIKVLDISAGHGMFGIAFAQQNPNAQVFGADWPKVLEVAKENATKLGVANRYNLIPGDATKGALGDGYDVVLIPNFLHHLSARENVNFLKRIHQALKPGGVVAILEFAPDDNRITPPACATFAVMMLAGTPEGDAYTVTELKKMLDESGFKDIKSQDLPMGMQRIISATK